MTPAEFRTIGEALRGPSWQTALARDLKRDVRLIRFWAAGERPIPDNIPGKLKRLLEKHIEKLTGIEYACFPAPPPVAHGGYLPARR